MNERGLILYLPFQGSANDYAVMRLKPTATDIASGGGVAGRSIYFNGSTSHITYPHNSRFLLNDFTVAFWVRRDGWQSSWGRFIDKYMAGGGFDITRNGDTNKLTFGVKGSTTCTSVSDIPDLKWIHVTCRRVGTTETILLNGRVDFIRIGGASGALTNTGILEIGRYVGGGYNQKCNIQDLRIYDYGLSSTQIAMVANQLAKDRANV